MPRGARGDPLCGDVFMDVVHEYPDITIHLTVFNASIAEGTPRKIEHSDIRWITPGTSPLRVLSRGRGYPGAADGLRP